MEKVKPEQYLRTFKIPFACGHSETVALPSSVTLAEVELDINEFNLSCTNCSPESYDFQTVS